MAEGHEGPAIIQPLTRTGPVGYLSSKGTSRPRPSCAKQLATCRWWRGLT